MPKPDIYKVPVPPGLKSGAQFQMKTDSGENISVKVPPGFKPGQEIEVKVPKPAVGAAAASAPMKPSVPVAQPVVSSAEVQLQGVNAANTVNVTNATNVTTISTTVKNEAGKDGFAEGEVTPFCSWLCGYSACTPSCAITCMNAILYAAASLPPPPLLRRDHTRSPLPAGAATALRAVACAAARGASWSRTRSGCRAPAARAA